ncbi:protein-disulfide reductase DsbD [Pelistega sp. MC2]|uniref:protein-disulfide reductase DsbD n=1 Tax=Pelistega sp. MC2 TaxID=1720297 RepID=UPI0008DA78B5|nr:protein-disulfide reductase DsbD [Pelistega sp. MC2]
MIALINRLYTVFLLALVSIIFNVSVQPVQAQENFLEPNQAFKLYANISHENQLNLQFGVADGYYMYKERFEFRSIIDNKEHDLLNSTSISYSKGDIKFDPTFNKEMEVYHHQSLVTIPIPTDTPSFTLEVTAQGCADAGLCYPPMYYYLPVTITSTGYDIALPKEANNFSLISSEEAQRELNTSTSDNNSTLKDSAPEKNSLDLLNAGDTEIASWLHNASLWHMLAVAFLLGLALSFTPCVLPMLPILLSLVVGSQKQQQSRFHSLRLTLLYVLGTSIVYTLLGIIAASIGAALANWIQNPWVLGIFALFLVIFGIAMFGAYNMQMPASVQTKLNNIVNKLPAGQGGAALLMGMISALICGPCVAAPLAGVLLFISQTGDIVKGGLILFLLAWGQGVSLILLGSSSGALLPKAGAWMDSVKKVCGLLLFAAALWMIAPLLPNWLPMLLWAALAIAFAYVIGTFRGYKPFPNFTTLLLKLVGWLAVIWAILLVIGFGIGSRSVLHPLAVQETTLSHVKFERIHTLSELKQILASTDKPIILDFYADWCVSCVEMEKFTFPNANVQTLLKNFRLLQVDVTKNTKDDRELLKAFQLFGPPGIIFFTPNGQENTQVRVIGFQNAERFTQSLEKALGSK